MASRQLRPPLATVGQTIEAGSAAKSASVTRVGYSHYLPDAAARRGMARRLFELVKSGALVPRPPRVLPLADAAEAHLLLESRALGPIVLVPEGGRRDA